VTTSRLVVSTSVLFLLTVFMDGPGTIWGAGSALLFQLFAAAMGLAYYLELIAWFNAVRHIDVSVASSITVPAPAVTMVLAAIFLGDNIQRTQVLALGVVAFGLLGLLWAGEIVARARVYPLR
jgi:drug/metabolite transporter (DMT)-like permease